MNYSLLPLNLFIEHELQICVIVDFLRLVGVNSLFVNWYYPLLHNRECAKNRVKNKGLTKYSAHRALSMYSLKPYLYLKFLTPSDFIRITTDTLIRQLRPRGMLNVYPRETDRKVSRMRSAKIISSNR